MSLSRREFIAYLSALACVSCSEPPLNKVSKAITSQTTFEPFDEFLTFDALGLAELIKSKQISSQDLLEVVIKRIEATNPKINFMTNNAFERARNKAPTFDKNSTFAGVPMLIKDMIDVGGIKRTDGSKLFENRMIEKNVAYIDAVEQAGFNILGMTNVPELASFIMTDNALFGATHNPWALEYSAFTSSGGSAAAIAAGVLPIAHGTDGAGSCRLPASVTGILGMKPSRYRIITGEVDSGHDRVKTNQFMSRTVRDNAAIFAQTEDKNNGHYPAVGLVTQPLTKKLIIGYVADIPNSLPVEPEVKSAQENTIKLLESLGHSVIPINYPIDFDKLMVSYLNFFADKVKGLKPVIEQMTGKSVIDAGVLSNLLATKVELSVKVTKQDMVAAMAYLDSLPQAFVNIFKSCDVILSPVSPVVGVKLDEASHQDNWTDDAARFMLDRLKFTAPVNWAGVPAMSVPLNWSKDNLPIGSHFIAPIGEDKLLYELAYQLEYARPWQDRWAPYSLMNKFAFS